MKRWQDDADYVAWLKARDYLGRGGEQVMTPGVYIYMWEAWLGGRRKRKRSPATRDVSAREA